jgi:1-acyl-sn-glycerol-3-phosphate acyltransferase
MSNEEASANKPQRPKVPESKLSLATRKFFYRVLRVLARILTVLWFRIRVDGRHHLPAEGGAMLLSTHQSLMDPILVGLACNRNLNFLARHTLFRNPAFSLLLKVLDSIEIDRERGGISGLKEMLARLKRGEIVLLFPEGTRTPDGNILPIKPGFLPVAKRSDVPLVPVAVVGAYECMPKGAKWIFPKPIAVVFGKPILVEEYRNCSDQEVIGKLSSSLADLYRQGKQLIEPAR